MPVVKSTPLPVTTTSTAKTVDQPPAGSVKSESKSDGKSKTIQHT